MREDKSDSNFLEIKFMSRNCEGNRMRKLGIFLGGFWGELEREFVYNSGACLRTDRFSFGSDVIGTGTNKFDVLCAVRHRADAQTVDTPV